MEHNLESQNANQGKPVDINTFTGRKNEPVAEM
jgi:hypothetical protein